MRTEGREVWDEDHVCVEHNQTRSHTPHSDSQSTPSLTVNSYPHPTLTLHSHPHLTLPSSLCTSTHSTIPTSLHTLILTPHLHPHTTQVHMYLLLHVLSNHPGFHLHCQVAGVHIQNLVLEHSTHRQSHCSLSLSWSTTHTDSHIAH